MSGAEIKNSSSYNEEEASLPHYTEPKNIDNALCLNHESQQTIFVKRKDCIMKNKYVRVTPSPEQYAAAALREASNFVKDVKYDYKETDRFMIKSTEKIMKRSI